MMDTLEPIAPQAIENTAFPQVALYQHLLGCYTTQLVYIAAELSLADLLSNGPQPVAQLARQTGCEPDGLARVMTSMSGIGLFRECAPGEFELTPMAEYLRSDVPGSLRDAAIYQGSPWHWQPFGRIVDRLRTGQCPFDDVHGMGLYEYLRAEPEAGAVFDGAMKAFSSQGHILAMAGYDFSVVRKIVDVGGGNGTLLVALLQMQPHLRGVVYDCADVADAAAVAIEQAGLGDRCETAAGNFFESVPIGADTYLLSMILVDLGDDDAYSVLDNVRRAVPPDGRLLILEMLHPGPNKRSFASLTDIELLATLPHGRQRTIEELGALFCQAGFGTPRVVPSMAPATLVEAVPN